MLAQRVNGLPPSTVNDCDYGNLGFGANFETLYRARFRQIERPAFSFASGRTTVSCVELPGDFG